MIGALRELGELVLSRGGQAILGRRVSFVTGQLAAYLKDPTRPPPPEALARMAAAMTDATLKDAQAALDEASIVFAHSLLDAVAFSYCRVAALVCPFDWEPVLKDRCIRLGDLAGASYDDLVRAALEKYLKDLEKESVLRKVDELYRICQPPANWSGAVGYEFDRNWLAQIDDQRHRIVHGPVLGALTGGIEGDLEYLLKTEAHLLGLLEVRYRIRIDPDRLARLLGSQGSGQAG